MLRNIPTATSVIPPLNHKTLPQLIGYLPAVGIIIMFPAPETAVGGTLRVCGLVPDRTTSIAEPGQFPGEMKR